jgi:hypothetical protein
MLVPLRFAVTLKRSDQYPDGGDAPVVVNR